MVESQAGKDSLFTLNEAAAYATEGALAEKPPIIPPPTVGSTSTEKASMQIEAPSFSFDQSVTDSINRLLSGELPSNQTVNEFLSNADRSLLEQSYSAQLDSQGRRLVKDLRHILSSSKSFLNNTNADERFQKFLKEAANFTKDITDKTQYAASKMKRTTYDAQEEAKDLIYNLKDLLFQIVRSSDFRQLMDEFVVLFKNMSGRFEKQGKRLKKAVKKDVAKEDVGASSTKQAIKDVKKETWDRGSSFVMDEKTKDRIYDRFEKLLYKLTSNNKYHDAVDNLFNIFDYYNRRWDQLQKDPNLSLSQDKNYNEMLSDAQYVIGQFCGEDNWNAFVDESWSLWKDVKNDKQANEFFKELKSFIMESFDNPEKFKRESERQRLRKFLDRSYNLFDRKSNQYADRFNDLYDCLTDMFDYASEQTADLTHHLNKFASDLVTDNYGKPSLYVTQNSLIQFKRLIAPMLSQGLANIPLPKISGQNDTYDWSIDQVYFDGRGILPENYHFKFISDFNYNTNTDRNDFYSELQMRLDNIDLAFKNIEFYYLRKSIPSIEDRGIADCKIKGLKFSLTWSLYSEPNEPFRVELKEVKTHMEDLDITIIDSKHNILDNIVATLFPGYIKKQLSDTLVGTLKGTFEPFTFHLNEYFKKQKDYWEDRMEQAWEHAEHKFEQIWSTSKKDVKEKAENVQEKVKDTAQVANQWLEENVDWSSLWKK